ncbi:hypothetical protein BLAT2472_10658 [Burkholderia latens]
MHGRAQGSAHQGHDDHQGDEEGRRSLGRRQYPRPGKRQGLQVQDGAGRWRPEAGRARLHRRIAARPLSDLGSRAVSYAPHIDARDAIKKSAGDDVVRPILL